MMTPEPTGFPVRFADYAARVETTCDRWLPQDDATPARLHQAMRYALLGGGKRLRPLLVYATGEALNIAPERLDGPAAAVELIHAYSLIHDDLPAMDDDDLRRGRPTVHKAFDEATAILAGDALQPVAFDILAGEASIAVGADTRMAMIRILAAACGSRGMAGGQAIDLEQVGRAADLATVERMHRYKTGCLISASVQLAAALAEDLPDAVRADLTTYGDAIGLAFQIHDDVLDEVGDTATLGKTGGADRARGKPTFPAAIGVSASVARVRELTDEARGALASLGPAAKPLHELAEHLVARAH